MTPTRVLIAVAVCCASASSSTANSAPCESLAGYLRELIQSHPEDTVDTGHFEFLKAAINLGYDADYLPPATPNVVGSSVPAADLPRPTNPKIAVIGSRSFESIVSALQSLKSGETASAAAWLQTNYFEDSPNTYTDIRELRPYSPYVIVSQNGGTMHCTGAAFFRLELKRLEPISKLPTEEAGLCWTSGLTGIRIDSGAYPAIWNVENTAAGINYSINLLDLTHSTPDNVVSLCTVNTSFSPSESIDYWYPSAGIPDDLLLHLRNILQATLVGHSKDDPAGVLKKMEPQPTGDSPYDEFLLSADRGSQELLREIDPDGKMAEIPNTDEQAYTMFDGLGEITEPIPIAVDGHRLLLIVDVPIFGWRSADDRAFAVWEWNGSGITPVVSGYLGRHAASPTITVH